MKRSGFVTLWIIAVFLGFWFYKSHLVKQFVVEKLDKLEKSENVSFKYDGLSTGGFPLSNEVTIKNPRVTFKGDRNEEVNFSLDGSLIVGSNLQGSQSWMTYKGDLFLDMSEGQSFNSSLVGTIITATKLQNLMSLKETIEEQTGRNVKVSGEGTVIFSFPEYNLTKAFPESFYHDDPAAIFKDILHKGESYGNRVSVYTYNTRDKLIPMSEMGSYHGGWRTIEKDKNLREFAYKFEGSAVDAFLKALRKENQSLPDPGPHSIALEGNVIFDSSLPWGEPIQLFGSLSSAPFAFNIKKAESKDRFDNSKYALSFELKPDPEAKKSEILFDSDFTGRFSKEGFDIYSFKLAELFKQAKEKAPEDAKKMYELIPQIINELTPQYYNWGDITNRIQINAKISSAGLIGVLPETVEIKHFDFFAKDTGMKVNGSFAFKPLPSGSLVIDLLDYKSLIEGIANYYNKVHTTFGTNLQMPLTEYARPISAQTVEEIVGFVKTLADSSSPSDKNATITIQIPQDMQVTVGGKKVEDIAPVFMTLAEKVRNEVAPEKMAAPKKEPQNLEEEPKEEPGKEPLEKELVPKDQDAQGK